MPESASSICFRVHSRRFTRAKHAFAARKYTCFRVSRVRSLSRFSRGELGFTISLHKRLWSFTTDWDRSAGRRSRIGFMRAALCTAREGQEDRKWVSVSSSVPHRMQVASSP